MRLYPSMMCVPPDKTKLLCGIFAEEGMAGLHIDIMDGTFVPNFTLGTDYCRYLHEISPLPLDIHLMIDRPEDKLSFFPIKEGDMVSVHAESTPHLMRAVNRIRERGAKPYAAINPATPIADVFEVLPYVEGVLIMTVNPGFAGQRLIGSMSDKVKRMRRLMDDYGFQSKPIEVDGNISPENLKLLKEAGAGAFVIGSSGFDSGSETDEIRRSLRVLSEI